MESSVSSCVCVCVCVCGRGGGGVSYYRSVRLPCVVSQLRTCRARFFFAEIPEKPCVLDKVSVVYFKGKLYFSRCTRFC